MSNGKKICWDCGEDKPLSEYRRGGNYKGGVSARCIPCLDKRQATQPRPLSATDIAVLQALRNNGLAVAVIEDRLGRNCQNRLPKLLARGLVGQDAEGFYGLTDAGRAACPYRNHHLEARRKRQLKQEAGHAHA